MAEEPKALEQFTIFWTIFGHDNPILMPIKNGNMLHYEVNEDTSFPIYISGEQLDEFNESQFESLEVVPLNMAAGALLGCRPPRQHFPTQGPYDLRPLLSAYLDRYSTELGYDKLDDLVLELSSILRSRNGSGASIAALKNSEYLNVNFFKVLNDLLLDLWGRLPDVDDSSLPDAVLEFYTYLSKVKLDELHPNASEWFNYARAVSLLYLYVTKTLPIDITLLTEAISRNEHPKARKQLNQLLRDNRFDRNLF